MLKMNTLKNIAVFLVLITLLTSSCKDKTPLPNNYDAGVFIVNEGVFLGTGTVSFYDRKDSVANNIFAKENLEEPLGDVLQSMVVHNGKAYMIINHANKIVVADKSTFKKITTITEINLPRYMQVIDDTKAYITNWGTDKNGANGAVQVLDLQTNTIKKTIDTKHASEAIVKIGTNVYIANSAGLYFDGPGDSTVTVIDTKTDAITKTIFVGINPTAIAADKNGSVWVLCSGTWDGKVSGHLMKITNDKVEKDILVESGSQKLAMNATGDRLYFTEGYDKVSYIDIAAPDKVNVFASRAAYGLGVDPKTGNVYIADAGDFKSAGNVFIYRSTDKVLIDSVSVGVGPNGFWFE
jgi:YVTN family beta-propeller protein